MVSKKTKRNIKNRRKTKRKQKGGSLVNVMRLTNQNGIPIYNLIEEQRLYPSKYYHTYQQCSNIIDLININIDIEKKLYKLLEKCFTENTLIFSKFTAFYTHIYNSFRILMTHCSNLNNNTNAVNYSIKDIYNIIKDTINNSDIEQKLQTIQSSLVLHHGSFSEEVPEQKMAVMYLTGNEKVLEIGGNIGRNSLIIASIIKNAGQLSDKHKHTKKVRIIEPVQNRKPGKMNKTRKQASGRHPYLFLRHLFDITTP